MSFPEPINVYRTRVRSHQTDLNGVVWHGAFLGIFDDARIETFRTLDYTYARVVSEGWQLVVRRIQCDYLSPARMDDLLSVRVTAPAMTRATLQLAFECRRDGVDIARGVNTYVFLDLRGRPIRVPQTLRTLIHEHARMFEYDPAHDRRDSSSEWNCRARCFNLC
jgi:acyl-CoA thioester hydrolase